MVDNSDYSLATNSISELKEGVSVVIATYNGSNVLADTLSCLIEQKFNQPFEIVIVDNASTDCTSDFVKKWWSEKGANNITFKVLSQPIPGKSYAQDLGFSKAQFKYLLVCDDDNQLFPDYLQTAYDYMESHREVGLLGGLGIAKSDKPIPEWFNEFQEMYAVGPQHSDSGDITQTKSFVNGAGAVIGNDLWSKIASSDIDRILTCRKGNSLSAGGDNEMGYLIKAAGYEIHYLEDLKFHHFISSDRFSLDYLIRLREGYVDAYETLSSYTSELNHHLTRTNSIVLKDLLISLLRLGILLIITPFISKSNKKHELRKTFHRGRIKSILHDFRSYPQIRYIVKRNLDLASSLTQ